MTDKEIQQLSKYNFELEKDLEYTLHVCKNEDLELKNKLFENIHCNINEYKLEITKCKFVNCTISGKIESSDISETIFEGCDLSNTSFNDSNIYKVIFINCKCIGSSFLNTNINNLHVENSNYKYGNFNAASIKESIFKNSILDHAYFNESKISNLKFENNSMIESGFFKTSLNEIDLSSCNISGISVSLEYLKGLTVNDNQAIQLSKLLGIKIKE